MIALRFTVVLLIAAFLTLPSTTAGDKPIVIVHARLIDGLGGSPLEMLRLSFAAKPSSMLDLVMARPFRTMRKLSTHPERQ